MNRNIMTFMGAEADYEAADIVLFGAPFDGTTSFRPGTRFAPDVIRRESYGIETYSPLLDRDLEDCAIADIGNLDFPFGNTEKVLGRIEETVDKILSDKKIPLLVGGEHLVSLGAIRSAVRHHENLRIIHLDAHGDLREDYLGEILSHATVMRRAYDLVGEKRIYQFGIRSGPREEFAFAREHTFFHPFSLEGIEQYLPALREVPVYLSIDLDVLDPGVFPGTGTPEPDGASVGELIGFIHKLKGLSIIGADVVELSPTYDPSGISSAAAVKVLRELMLVLGEEN